MARASASIAIRGKRLGTVSVSTSRVPSLMPILAIYTTFTGKAAEVCGTRELHVGRYSHLATATGLVGSLNNGIARLPSKLIVRKVSALGNKFYRNFGSREVMVSTNIYTMELNNRVRSDCTLSVGGDCPSFCVSCGGVKNGTGILSLQ